MRKSVAYEPCKKTLHHKSDSFSGVHDYRSAENILIKNPKPKKPKIPKSGQQIHSTHNLISPRTENYNPQPEVVKIGTFLHDHLSNSYDKSQIFPNKILSGNENTQRGHNFDYEQILPNNYQSESHRGANNKDNSLDLQIMDNGFKYKFIVNNKKDIGITESSTSRRINTTEMMVSKRSNVLREVMIHNS